MRDCLRYVRLAAGETRPTHENMVLSQYVRDGTKENRLLDMEPYRLESSELPAAEHSAADDVFQDKYLQAPFDTSIVDKEEASVNEPEDSLFTVDRPLVRSAQHLIVSETLTTSVVASSMVTTASVTVPHVGSERKVKCRKEWIEGEDNDDYSESSSLSQFSFSSTSSNADDYVDARFWSEDNVDMEVSVHSFSAVALRSESVQDTSNTASPVKLLESPVAPNCKDMPALSTAAAVTTGDEEDHDEGVSTLTCEHSESVAAQIPLQHKSTSSDASSLENVAYLSTQASKPSAITLPLSAAECDLDMNCSAGVKGDSSPMSNENKSNDGNLDELDFSTATHKQWETTSHVTNRNVTDVNMTLPGDNVDDLPDSDSGRNCGDALALVILTTSQDSNVITTKQLSPHLSDRDNRNPLPSINSSQPLIQSSRSRIESPPPRTRTRSSLSQLRTRSLSSCSASLSRHSLSSPPQFHTHSVVNSSAAAPTGPLLMSRTADGGGIDLLQKNGDGDGGDASKDSLALDEAAPLPSTIPPGGCESKKHKFTLVEDLAIIYFIVANRCATEVKGKAMWLKLEASRAVGHRSWQSLKDRYLKYILPDVTRYKLSHRVRRILRNKIIDASIKDEDGSDHEAQHPFSPTLHSTRLSSFHSSPECKKQRRKMLTSTPCSNNNRMGGTAGGQRLDDRSKIRARLRIRLDSSSDSEGPSPAATESNANNTAASSRAGQSSFARKDVRIGMNHSMLSSSEDDDSEIISTAAAAADVDSKPCIDGNNNKIQASYPAASSDGVDKLSQTASIATFTADNSTGEDGTGAIDFKNITGNETRFDWPEARVDHVEAAVSDGNSPLESVETKLKPRWFYRTKSPEISTSTFGGLTWRSKTAARGQVPILCRGRVIGEIYTGSRNVALTAEQDNDRVDSDASSESEVILRLSSSSSESESQRGDGYVCNSYTGKRQRDNCVTRNSGRDRRRRDNNLTRNIDRDRELNERNGIRNSGKRKLQVDNRPTYNSGGGKQVKVNNGKHVRDDGQQQINDDGSPNSRGGKQPQQLCRFTHVKRTLPATDNSQTGSRLETEARHSVTTRSFYSTTRAKSKVMTSSPNREHASCNGGSKKACKQASSEHHQSSSSVSIDKHSTVMRRDVDSNFEKTVQCWCEAILRIEAIYECTREEASALFQHYMELNTAEDLDDYILQTRVRDVKLHREIN